MAQTKFLDLTGLAQVINWAKEKFVGYNPETKQLTQGVGNIDSITFQGECDIINASIHKYSYSDDHSDQPHISMFVSNKHENSNGTYSEAGMTASWNNYSKIFAQSSIYGFVTNEQKEKRIQSDIIIGDNKNSNYDINKIAKYNININSDGYNHSVYDVNGTSIGEIKMGVVSVDGEIDNYSYNIGIKSSDNNPNHCFTTDGKTFDLSTKLNVSSIGSIDPFDIEMLF